MARYTGPVCRLVPARGDEALSEGCALRRAEVPDREAAARQELSAGSARATPDAAAVRVWSPASREAEGAPLLRRHGEPVPQALRGGRASRRRNRRQPAADSGIPTRQRRLPHGIRRFAEAGAAARSARAFHGQRSQDQHPFVPGQARRRRDCAAGRVVVARISRITAKCWIPGVRRTG